MVSVPCYIRIFKDMCCFCCCVVVVVVVVVDVLSVVKKRVRFEPTTFIVDPTSDIKELWSSWHMNISAYRNRRLR
jgi:hypothetical protein